MLVIRVWNFLKGYVTIVVEGYFLEKFINICVHRQILLWDIKRLKNRTMTLKVSINGFRMMRPVCRKTKCRVKILNKRGLPFILNRYRKRKAFAVGAIFFIIIIYTLTSFIWAVEIEGNERIKTDVIRESLSSLGVKPGVLKYTIDTDKIVENIMMNTSDIAWIGVLVRGTKVKVEVVERKPAPQMIDRDMPCDIVALRDGIVLLVITKEGKPLVKEGDTVSKDQLLIAGKVDSKIEGIQTRFVHAMGEVIARTWYEENCDIERVSVERIRTGNIKNKRYLLMFNTKISLFLDKTTFENYDKIDNIKKISLGEDAVLPFGFITERYYEVRLVKNELDLEQAMQLAANEAYDAILRRIPAGTKITRSDVFWRETEDGKQYANVVVECEENIGIQRELGGM